MRFRSVSVVLLTLAVSLAFIPACGAGKAPPNLSPQGVRDWNNTRVVKALDVIRDTAIDANATTPPMMQTESTRAVVQFHKSALITINSASTGGWKAAVQTGLDELVKNLPPADAATLSPYIALLKTLLASIAGEPEPLSPETRRLILESLSTNDRWLASQEVSR